MESSILCGLRESDAVKVMRRSEAVAFGAHRYAASLNIS